MKSKTKIARCERTLKTKQNRFSRDGTAKRNHKNQRLAPPTY